MTAKERAFWRRVTNTMEREMLCSEHAAICFMAALDKNRGRKTGNAGRMRDVREKP